MFAAAVELHGHDRHDHLLMVFNAPWAPLRAEWGTDSAAQDGQRAMMELAGGPAPPRDPAKQRPRSKEG